MNAEETKLVTMEDDNELKLFYLPYFLKCEKSMNFKETFGFTITNIAFSHNEKLVIVGGSKTLAVAEIESIEEFFDLDIEKDQQR